jgi:hypothetical protein
MRAARRDADATDYFLFTAVRVSSTGVTALLSAVERERLAAQADEVRNVWRESSRAQHHLGARARVHCVAVPAFDGIANAGEFPVG